MTEESDSPQPEDDAFTFPGLNDTAKPCPEGCGGLVQPTINANVGECDKCGTKYSWGKLK